MPEVSRGPRGYADWQRVANWDGPTLLEDAGTERVKLHLTPFEEVSRYGYLSGTMQAEVNDVVAEFSWYENTLEATPIASRQIYLSKEISHPAQFRIPNMGPFVRIALFANTEVLKYKWKARIFATNRVSHLEFLPETALVMQSAVNFVGEEQINTYPAQYCNGPVIVQYSSGVGVKGTFDLETPNAAGTYFRYERTAITENTVFSFRGVLPPQAFRVKVASKGAGELQTIIMASQTGGT